MISLSSSGSTDNMRKFLERMKTPDILSGLEILAQMGVEALRANTKEDTGVTAESWDYEITQTKTFTSITWTNSHTIDGANVAILLQYGHTTGTGGYVQGVDYINPAMKPVFDQISTEMWRRVTSA